MAKEVLWEVVGGATSDGILVRSGASLATRQDGQRLATGAVIRQIERTQGRVRYELVRGEGPNTGWVSLCLRGKDLLARRRSVDCGEVAGTRDERDDARQREAAKAATRAPGQERTGLEYPKLVFIVCAFAWVAGVLYLALFGTSQ
ncbi:unnamed protein product [Symbiodinium natans]|uniref:Uncharacterized protein n=1 Tax=Symbiodinium natans TaxID=878477 RepID=A0A812RXL1_9DINO|nr:unnamed protein product [Symbiodinium natans]